VLVDGIKINMASAGLASLEHLPVDTIERIEVVHGSRSSLYGSEAIGGVIQIFTRKGKNGFHPEVSLQAGSHHSYKVNTNLNGSNGTTWYNLNAGKEQTDGFNACNPSKGCFYNEPDKDGYTRQTAAIRAGHQFSANTEAELSVLRANGDVQYDGATNQADTVQHINALKLRHTLNAKAQISAQLGQTTDKATNHTPSGTVDGYYANWRNTATLQADIQTSTNGSLTLGVDQHTDKLSSDKVYSRTSRDNKAVFASYQHNIGRNGIDVAVRHDDNEQFGTKNTGNLSLGHTFNNGLRSTAAYATAFKAPTFNDLYYPASAFYQPNPNLRPENAHNIELGVSGKWAKGQWSVNAFQNRINDLIVYDFPTMKNIDKAQIKGIETKAVTQLAGFKVQGNLTLQQPENRTTALSGKQLSYRPKQLASVDVDKSVGKWTLGATLRGESKRYTNAANTDTLAGYGTVDLRASYALNQDWTVGAKLANVLDKDYQTNKGYNQDGINGLITLKYAPH
jgi:vitamin B12 transporter